ncbi:leucyl/phenylalanyl-tRNA--protein transferase [Pseudopelagicola sp. nBUS_19]|uniref:leucyl/phenylalanyl-tRNA--protein transferase n=1 Tax=Pseudopelagicola sp. nBUS_19 TaxID=3395316 RepID=UPI003EBE6C8B
MGELTPELLMRAYAMGVFPMAEHRDDPEIFWVDPIHRGIFPLDLFHISRSLARSIRRANYNLTLNQNFEGVLDGCANRRETWINAKIRNLYNSLYNNGQAHSIEVWEGPHLIGGVYGVTLGAAFFGESMFSRRTDASKIALAFLVEHLRRCGFILFDTQFLTEHLITLGAVEIPRESFKKLLNEAIQREADLMSQSLPSVSDVLQRKTQTS